MRCQLLFPDESTQPFDRFYCLCQNLLVLQFSMKFTSELAADVAAWVSTIISTVLLIFINKLLMSSSGFGFHYGKSSAFFARHVARDSSEPHESGQLIRGVCCSNNAER